MMAISLVNSESQRSEKLTSSSCRTESDQQVQTFGLSEPIELTIFVVFTRERLTFLFGNLVLTITLKRMAVEVQQAAALEVAVVVSETSVFGELCDFVLHALYGPVIERVAEFVVRFRAALRGHGVSCKERMEVFLVQDWLV
jgi:hypothetical protein